MSAPINTLKKTLKNWVQGIQDTDPTFKLHTIDPDAVNQLTIHALKDFPSSLQEIQGFFAKAKPLVKGGKLYMKILASFNSKPEDLTGNVRWYHQDWSERFERSIIQGPETAIVGWLQYSLPYMDIDIFQDHLSERCGYQLELRWMRVSDGSRWKPGQSYQDEPKAIHVWCDKRYTNQVQDFLGKTYGSSVKSFPMNTKLRFIKPIQQLCNQDS